MTKKEFNLSEKTHRGNEEINLPPYIDLVDIKEFIKLLKDEIRVHDIHGKCGINISQKIDKLAGSKLT